MIIGCTHDNAALATSFQMLPGSHLMDNYKRLQDNVNIWRGLANSIFISVTYTLISTYIGALTAYGFAKYKFRGNKVLFWIVLATMMLPGQLGIIGYFQEMNGLGLLDSYLSIIMPSFATPVMVYWIRQYIDAYVPNELMESARIDGCNEFKFSINYFPGNYSGCSYTGNFHICRMLELICSAVYSFVLAGEIYTSYFGTADARGIQDGLWCYIFRSNTISYSNSSFIYVLFKEDFGKFNGWCSKGIIYEI